MKKIFKIIIYTIIFYAISLGISGIAKLLGFVNENIFIYALILMIIALIINFIKGLIDKKSKMQEK